MRKKGLFCCYLLGSDHTDVCYVGFTVDPVRRLRQHNGELRGGARFTRRHRPWRMALLLHGFPCYTQALQFEWAMQNPARSRLAQSALASVKGAPPP